MKLELRADAEDLSALNKTAADYTLTDEEQAWLRYGRRVQRRLTEDEQQWLDAVWEYNVQIWSVKNGNYYHRPDVVSDG